MLDTSQRVNVDKYDLFRGLNVKHLGHTVECRLSERLSTEQLSERPYVRAWRGEMGIL